MNRLGFLSVLLVFAVSVSALEPTVLESSPPAGSEYTTVPQLIPFTVSIDYTEIEAAGRGQGGWYSWPLAFESVTDPERVFSFNEMTIINTSNPMDAGWGRYIYRGYIASKRLPAGQYRIVPQFDWQQGQAPAQHWEYPIPIILSGPAPAGIPPSAFQMNLVSPLEPARTRRFAVGTENSFSVEVTHTQVLPGPTISSFGRLIEISQIENPEVSLNPTQANFETDFMGPIGLTQGTMRVHNTLPVGHYRLRIYYTWQEVSNWEDPLTHFEYTDFVEVEFEIFDPANDHFVVERDLPRNPVIPGAPFTARLLVDPRSDSPTGVVVTENLPPELEFVPFEDTIRPESTTGSIVWLFRNSEQVPFTEVVYGLQVRDGTAPGTVIRMAGTAEILNEEQAIGGDTTITVAGITLSCPISNQELLRNIETWGRFVRDALLPDDPIIDDLTILQIIDRWRACLRGGN